MPSGTSWLARALEWSSSGARGLGTVLRDFFAGAAGTDAYRSYLAHHRIHHPELTPLTRETFFRETLASRWDGVRRCC